MTSLFVAEDADAETFPETKVKLETDLDADIHMQGEEDDIKVKGEQSETQTTRVEGVNEFYDDSDSDDEDADDPIIDTIPVHLNSKVDSEGNQLAPLLLQFPTKSRQSHLSQTHISALHRLQIKSNSGVVELRLPLNTDAFFSGIVSEKYNVNEQFLRGVIIHDEPLGTLTEGTISSASVMNPAKDDSKTTDKRGNTKASMMDSSQQNPNTSSTIRAQPGSVGGSRYLIGIQDKTGRMHVTPIADTCMLRPHFTYIDDAKMSKLEREREIQRELNDNRGDKNDEGAGNGNGKEEDNKKNVSVVTMSAKSTKENVPRLGGALLSAKMETEEQGKNYDIVSCGEEFIATHFMEKNGNVLHSKLTQNQYLDLLLGQTKL